MGFPCRGDVLAKAAMDKVSTKPEEPPSTARSRSEGTNWRNVGYWIIEVAGTFVCIAAFINLVLGRGDPLFYYVVLVLGLFIIVAGLPLRPKKPTGTR